MWQSKFDLPAPQANLASDWLSCRKANIKMSCLSGTIKQRSNEQSARSSRQNCTCHMSEIFRCANVDYLVYIENSAWYFFCNALSLTSWVTRQKKNIGHFRIPSCFLSLFLEQVLAKQLSYENEFNLYENERAVETHFHKNGFAWRLVSYWGKRDLGKSQFKWCWDFPFDRWVVRIRFNITVAYVFYFETTLFCTNSRRPWPCYYRECLGRNQWTWYTHGTPVHQIAGNRSEGIKILSFFSWRNSVVKAKVRLWLISLKITTLLWIMRKVLHLCIRNPFYRLSQKEMHHFTIPKSVCCWQGFQLYWNCENLPTNLAWFHVTASKNVSFLNRRGLDTILASVLMT